MVSAASYEARKFGVRSAMPIFQAKRLCPQGIYVPPRMERYLQVSRRVMRVLEGFSPLVEPISVDEAFVDLAGTESLWGPPMEAGALLKKEMLAQTGLKCSVGLAPLRFLAKIASDRDQARRAGGGGRPGGFSGHGGAERGQRGGQKGSKAALGHGPAPFG